MSLYGLACALPAYFVHGGEPVYGIACLLMPWGLFTPFWWANPLFFAGCFAMARGRAQRAIAYGIAASALAVTYFPLFSRRDSDGIGSAFWMAAMVGLAIAGLVASRAEARARTRAGSTCDEVATPTADGETWTAPDAAALYRTRATGGPACPRRKRS